MAKKSPHATPAEYLASLPADRKSTLTKMHKAIVANLPKGFVACINYGMIGYVVPHSLYPAGYHCSPELPLPFMCIASQKSHIALYHMGIYMDPALLKWFTDEHKKASPKKLDMGKSCTRYKKPEDVPLELIGKLARKMTPKQWVALYEAQLNKSRR